MRRLWPEILVLLLFLGGDVLWDGPASALAGLTAGALSYLLLVIMGRNRPALLAEGAVFSALSFTGTLLPVPGGTLIFTEAIIGVLLLSSGLLGWKVISRLSGELGRGLIPSGTVPLLERTMGAVFLIHSTAYGFFAYFHDDSLPVGILIFIALYMAGIHRIRRLQRSGRADETPEERFTASESDGRFRIERNGEVLCVLGLEEGSTAIAKIRIYSMEGTPREILVCLTGFARRRGFRVLSIQGWTADPLELELDGFKPLDGVYRRPI